MPPSPSWSLAKSASRLFLPTGSTPFVHAFRPHESSKASRPNCWRSTQNCWCSLAGSVANGLRLLHPRRPPSPPAMPRPQPAPEPEIPPARPVLAEEPSRFLLLEREVETEYRPQMLAALQHKVDAVAEQARGTPPACPHCGRNMRRQDTRPVTWLARCGCLHASVSRDRCPPCRYECRPLLDLLGVEPGRVSPRFNDSASCLPVSAPNRLG